jgi:uncharacterized protein YaaN involved in tellurite resistance
MSSNDMVNANTSDAEIQALKHLTPAELQNAKQLAQALDVRDSLAITGFGVKPQKELTALTDPILKMVTTQDAGTAGEVLTTLLLEIKSLDAGSFASKVESNMSKLPFIGGMFNRFQQFVSQYEKVSVKIDRTVIELEKSKNTLTRDIAMLDKLYDQNGIYFRQLLTYIGAGELKLEALRIEHADMVEQVRSSGDPIEAQHAADLGYAIARLERRVHDLKLAAMIALQSSPQIRLVQNSDQALTEKIQSSILTTIPLWKNQVIIAIALFDQKKATELQRSVTKTTNELLTKNAALLHSSTVDVARETERGIVEIETLRAVNEQLIATIQETIQIQQEGHRKRVQVETELGHLQESLSAKLAEVSHI